MRVVLGEDDRLTAAHRLAQLLLQLGKVWLATPQHVARVRKLQLHTEHALIDRTVIQAHHTLLIKQSVTDTGIGIAPEQQRVVFQEFHQIENEYQDRFPGTGLGLTISRRLMELMGGRLTMESTLGSGSTFSGDLPIVPETLREKEHGTTS